MHLLCRKMHPTEFNEAKYLRQAQQERKNVIKSTKKKCEEENSFIHFHENILFVKKLFKMPSK